MKQKLFDIADKMYRNGRPKSVCGISSIISLLLLPVIIITQASWLWSVIGVLFIVSSIPVLIISQTMDENEKYFVENACTGEFWFTLNIFLFVVSAFLAFACLMGAYANFYSILFFIGVAVSSVESITIYNDDRFVVKN